MNKDVCKHARTAVHAALLAAMLASTAATVAAPMHGPPDALSSGSSDPPIPQRGLSCSLEPFANAWWTSFNDSALNLLHALATQRSSDACTQVVLTAAYVQLRVLSVRLMVLESMLATANRQTALVGGGSAQSDSARELLSQRIENTAGQIRVARMLRQHFVQVLAQQTGLQEEQMVLMLAPVLREQSLPRFSIQLPAHAVTEARTETTDAAGQRLRGLSERSRAANVQAQLVDNRRAELELTRQRQHNGQASELESSERYFMMLVDTDRLAILHGDLALAWIELQSNMAGASTQDSRPGDSAHSQTESR
jgi:hypothetical protein